MAEITLLRKINKLKEQGLSLVKSRLHLLPDEKLRDRHNQTHPTNTQNSMTRRQFLGSLAGAGVFTFFGDIFKDYKTSLDIFTAATIQNEITASEQMKRAEILSLVMEKNYCHTANYASEKGQYIFHPLDGFPTIDYAQQLTYVENSIQFWDQQHSSDSTVSSESLSESFSFDHLNNDKPTLTSNDLKVGEVLFLRTDVSNLGYNKLTEAFLIVRSSQDNSPHLFRLFGEARFNETISLAQLKSLYPSKKITEAVLYDPGRLAELQAVCREGKPKEPIFGPEVNNLPLDTPEHCQQYGMKDSWGNGQSTNGAPTTTEEYAAFVLQRHKRYEDLLRTGDNNSVLNASLDLTMVAGDTTSFFYANKIGEVEAVIKEVYKQFQDSNQKEGLQRKVRFSFNIRVPGMWADKQSGSRAGDMIYKFIESFYKDGSLFSKDLLDQFAFDWTIDPELPGVAGRKANSTVRRISTTDLANLECMIQHYSPKSRLLVYDFGTNTTDNLLNEDGPYPQNVGYCYMGTLKLDEGVEYLTDQMIESKRQSITSLLRDMYRKTGQIPSDVSIMISDRELNNNYASQVNDGFMTSEILKKLTAPIEVIEGVFVRVNIVLQ